MGYDIIAYFYVNQNEIEEFINTNNIDKDNWKQHRIILDYYKEKNPDIKDLNIIYKWNKNCGIHEFFDYYGTNFIRDDKRFTNEMYHQVLTEKYNRIFPFCLTNINWYLHTAKDAIEIADELSVFFGEDENLMSFAEWLRITSRKCAIYELSY